MCIYIYILFGISSDSDMSRILYLSTKHLFVYTHINLFIIYNEYIYVYIFIFENFMTCGKSSVDGD